MARRACELLCGCAVKQARLIVLLVAASCSGGGGDDGSPNTPAGGDVTLDSLPDSARQAFEAWKAQPIKDCAWEQAFPSLAGRASDSPYTPQNGVDFAALLASNHGSPLLTGDDGQLALIGSGEHDVGFRHHGFQQTTTVNGKAESLDVKSTLDDGVCVVSLAGQEVYHGDLSVTVPIYLSFDRDKLTATGTDLTAMRTATLANGQLLGAVSSPPLVASALNLLKPDTRVNPFLAARFAITQAVAGALFLPSTFGLRTPDAIRLTAPAGTTPFVVGRDIYGPPASLQSLYDGGSFVAEFLYRLTDSSPDLVGLRVALSVDAGGKAAKATAITAEPNVPFSDPAFLACFAQRHQAASFEAAQLRSPEFDEQFFGCEGLTRDGYAALAADGTTRAAITQLALAGPGPFRGWDGALIAIAKRVYAQGNELSTLGDSQTPALAPILAHWDTLRGAFADAKTRDAFAPALIETVFGWHFQGLAPSDDLVSSIHTALIASAPRFPASTREMLAALAVDISTNSLARAALTCATDLTGDRAAAVDHAVTTVSSVLYSADFVNDFLGSFLQDCPLPGQLTSLEATSAATTSFITADAARDPDGILFPSAIRSVVSQALAQRWTTNTFAALADLEAFGFVSEYTYCNQLSQAEQAVCIDPGSFDVFSAASGKMLAPAAAPRYAQLARELTMRWPGLADAEFVSARFDIGRRFFQGMWLSCSDDGFARAKAQLFTLMDKLKTASSLDRFDVEQQISDLVSSTCP